MADQPVQLSIVRRSYGPAERGKRNVGDTWNWALRRRSVLWSPVAL
jgi:hypothetical protein